VTLRRALAISAVAVLVTAVVTSLASAAPPVPAKAKKLKVTSPAFADNQPIPDGFTCDGANASPPLRLGKVPKSTKDRALIVTDPDAPVGTIVHWVAWHLPKSGLPEQSIPASVVQGTNTLGNQTWSGPCPPRGSAPHRYIFTVYAVSKRIDLAPGASADDLRAAIKGKIVAQGKLTGTYQRT
jgi:Raf kinase inhibitor-like YbhB/YbcL family protein